MCAYQTQNEPYVQQIRTGWAAYGDWWAVHANTRDEVIALYWARKRFYEALSAQFKRETEQESAHEIIERRRV